jgi:hypothetical protein
MVENYILKMPRQGLKFCSNIWRETKENQRAYYRKKLPPSVFFKKLPFRNRSTQTSAQKAFT